MVHNFFIEQNGFTKIQNTSILTFYSELNLKNKRLIWKININWVTKSNFLSNH